MPPVTTAIDDQPADLQPYEISLIERVKEHGWQTTSVGAETDGDPAFSYTIGFWLTVRQPEVIVFDFPPQLAHDVFGTLMRRAREGHRFVTGEPVEGILSNEIVYFLPVTRAASVEYLRSSDWFYRRAEFPVVQLVWADRTGRFPWENDFDKSMAKLQPDLSDGYLHTL